MEVRQGPRVSTYSQKKCRNHRFIILFSFSKLSFYNSNFILYYTIFSPSYQFWYCKAYDVNLVDVDRDWLWEGCQAGESYILYLSLYSYMYFSFFCLYIHLLCLTRGAQPDKKIATRQVQRLKSPLLWIEISADQALKVKGYEAN